MTQQRFFRYFFKACPLYSRAGIGEKFIYKFTVKADCLEQSRRVVASQCRDAHFAHCFENAFFYRGDKIIGNLNRLHFCGQFAGSLQFVETLERQIRIDRVCAVSAQQAEVHYFSRFAAFNDNARAGSQTCFHQGVMNRRCRQQRRNRSHTF